MKTKRIYPKEWSEWHPYRKTTDVDVYYADFATDLYDFLADIPIHRELFEQDCHTREFCICLTAWFEDIISGTGIWQSFTSECKRLYGTYLPFFYLSKNYFPGEINEEDIRFLIWHHVRQMRENPVIYPEDPIIASIARELYHFLMDDYEVAPENELMQAYFNPRRTFEDFQEYRTFLEWFHFHCYFNAFNHTELATEENTTLNELAFKSRKNFLSLTTPEWLAKIFVESPQAEVLRNVKKEELSYFKITSEETEYLIADDLCDDNKKGLHIMKQSLDQRQMPKVGQTISCVLIHYNNTYWQSGPLAHCQENPALLLTIENFKRESAK
ncbi:DUF3843 family protein [uncultured Parabacteroides sp.]|uniref:DUF3843 family protein n=1 Tax=uncultured Parabacteroides sp. TaxID=512312 RepID=UPI00262627C8|nr:DUF3843 family protein [uncultured Parabacteroides sp.]